MRHFLIICMFLFLTSCFERKAEKPHFETVRNEARANTDESVNSPQRDHSSVYQAVIQSKIMSRDSGKPVDSAFLASCIKEQTLVYTEFYCDDLLWSYYVAQLSGKKTRVFYIIEDGASVENRALISIEGKKVVSREDNLPKLLSYELITKWLSIKFPGKTFTKKKLEKVAHSRYRTQLPKKADEWITILSGYNGDVSTSLKPIGQAKWTDDGFVLIPPSSY